MFLVKSITTDAVFTAFYALNYRLADQAIDYQQASAPPSPLQHFWSLAVEEQFYFAWPIVIMVCVWIGGRYRWQVLGVVLTCDRCLVTVAVDHDHPRQRAARLLLAADPRLGTVRRSGAGDARGTIAATAKGAGRDDVVDRAGDGCRYRTLVRRPDRVSGHAGDAAGCRCGAAAGVRVPGDVVERREIPRTAPRASGWASSRTRGTCGTGRCSCSCRAFTSEVNWFHRLEISAVALFLAAASHFLIEAPALRTRLRKPRWFTTGVALQGATAAVALVIASSVPAFAGSGAATSAVAFNPTDPSSIQAQLVEGLQIADAPRNLTPSLLDAPADLPVAGFDNGCHADYLTVKQPACVFGDPSGTQTLVLMGDSHAQQWMPALDVAAKEAGWKLVSWTKAACSVADVTLIEAKIGRNYWECDEWRRQTIANIIALEPDLLVISQSDSVPGDQFTNTEWADATGKTISTLQQAGVPVVFMLDTPQPAHDIPECLAEHLGDVGACNSVGHLSDYEGRRDDVQSVLGTIGVTVVDPVDWFCVGRSQCPAIVGNLLVYRDLTHMTRAYSEHLAPMIVPLLERDG